MTRTRSPSSPSGMARFLGTGRYLAAQTIFVIVWIGLNVVAVVAALGPVSVHPAQPGFSTQAAYAAPLILLAQNRQADRDRAEVERDRETNARSLADTEYLAREMAGVRLTLERKADREDVTEALDRLTRAIEQSYGAGSCAVRGRRPTATQSSRNRRTSSGAGPRPRGPTIGGVIARSHRAPCIAVDDDGVAGGRVRVGRSGDSSTAALDARRPPRACPGAAGQSGAADAGPGPGPVPTPGPTGVPAAANAVSVIRAWSDALRHGDVQSAARYFALPSVMVNGSDGAGDGAGDHDRRPGPGRGRQRLAALRRAAHLNRPAWAGTSTRCSA